MVTGSEALPRRAIRWCGSSQVPVDVEAIIDAPVLVEAAPPAPVVEVALLPPLLPLLLAEVALLVLLASLVLLVVLMPLAPPVPCGQMAASGSASQRDCHFVS